MWQSFEEQAFNIWKASAIAACQFLIPRSAAFNATPTFLTLRWLSICIWDVICSIISIDYGYCGWTLLKRRPTLWHCQHGHLQKLSTARRIKLVWPSCRTILVNIVNCTWLDYIIHIDNHSHTSCMVQLQTVIAASDGTSIWSPDIGRTCLSHEIGREWMRHDPIAKLNVHPRGKIPLWQPAMDSLSLTLVFRPSVEVIQDEIMKQQLPPSQGGEGLSWC